MFTMLCFTPPEPVCYNREYIHVDHQFCPAPHLITYHHFPTHANLSMFAFLTQNLQQEAVLADGLQLP